MEGGLQALPQKVSRLKVIWDTISGAFRWVVASISSFLGILFILGAFERRLLSIVSGIVLVLISAILTLPNIRAKTATSKAWLAALRVLIFVIGVALFFLVMISEQEVPSFQQQLAKKDQTINLLQSEVNNLQATIEHLRFETQAANIATTLLSRNIAVALNFEDKTTAPDPDFFTDFTDSKMGFRFSYPKAWGEVKVITLSSADSSYIVSGEEYKIEFSNENSVLYLSSLSNDYSHLGREPTLAEALTQSDKRAHFGQPHETTENGVDIWYALPDYNRYYMGALLQLEEKNRQYSSLGLASRFALTDDESTEGDIKNFLLIARSMKTI